MFMVPECHHCSWFLVYRILLTFMVPFFDGILTIGLYSAYDLKFDPFSVWTGTILIGGKKSIQVILMNLSHCVDFERNLGARII